MVYRGDDPGKVKRRPDFGNSLLWSGCRDLNPGSLDPQVSRRKALCSVPYFQVGPERKKWGYARLKRLEMRGAPAGMRLPPVGRPPHRTPACGSPTPVDNDDQRRESSERASYCDAQCLCQPPRRHPGADAARNGRHRDRIRSQPDRQRHRLSLDGARWKLQRNRHSHRHGSTVDPSGDVRACSTERRTSDPLTTS